MRKIANTILPDFLLHSYFLFPASFLLRGLRDLRGLKKTKSKIKTGITPGFFYNKSNICK